MLQNPVVKSDKKQAVLDAVFGGKLAELTAGYLKILLAKGREGLVVDMVAEGQRQMRVLRNIQEVSVTTAVPLTEDLRSRILAQVAQVHKGEVEMKELFEKRGLLTPMIRQAAILLLPPPNHAKSLRLMEHIPLCHSKKQ